MNTNPYKRRLGDLQEIWLNEGSNHPFSYWLFERIERALRHENASPNEIRKEALDCSIYASSED